MRKRGRGRRVGIVVGGHEDGLHRSNRAVLGRSDALLQLADFGVEVWLVADGGGHPSKERGDFRAGLDKTENIVNEEEDVEMLLVAEILGDGQAGEADAQARSGRLGHLAVNQGGAGFLGVARHNNAGFRHFQQQVVAFAGALADAREY